MKFQELNNVIEFLKNAERLKDTLRSGYTSKGRKESVADHTWRLCLFAITIHNLYFPDLDIAKLLKICIIHDLGEALNGDIPAPQQNENESKSAMEEKDFKKIIEPLSKKLKDELFDLWNEYETASSKEAKLAKALDKLETLIQHNQGKNPSNFDYNFNLSYGSKYTSYTEPIAILRQIIDEETSMNLKKQNANKH
ncbi:MAG: HD domain-containing protein [Balneola sp.]|nr:HD domain-containing protein [Balneola sp.]MBO6650442.1 HD domain-containing protein [Balneola sp.]MBO6710162.1 HD domain-containing protein [Balneola sp.]MBO6798846.1 HD domain-containing protein [Balneola sp.]MBO6869960.1 HD domain-containing protein [Balneola sp.]